MDTTDYNYGQSSKNGNVVKCPSCGAPVKVGSLVCPECVAMSSETLKPMRR